MIADNKPMIRQGWLRVVLYMLLCVALVYVANAILGKVTVKFNLLSREEESSTQKILVSYSVIAAVLIIMALLQRRFIDKERIGTLGFQWKGYQRHAAAGFFLGVLLLSIGSLILVMVQFLFFTGITFNSNELLLSLIFFVVVAFTEEIAFRGYILNNLLQSTNKWMALLLSSLLFALFHGANANISFLALLNIFVAGFLLGVNYIFTRNLWFAIFLHFSWNFFQGPVLGFGVSGMNMPGMLEQTLKGPDTITGGQFGFEGSLVCLLLNVLTCVFLTSYYTGYRSRSVAEFK